MFGCCGNLFCRCGGCAPCFRPVSPVTPPPFFPPVTPPSAPRQLRGMQLSLRNHSAGTVASGGTILYDSVDSNSLLGVSYTSGSGAVTFSRTGNYLVNWWVSVENTQAAEILAFALQVNGTNVQVSYSDNGGGQVFGTAIVNVSSVGTVLELVNESGSAVTFATASKQSGMTITQFA